MKGIPRITIVTACYNSADTIERTIRSIVGQEYPDLEYIVVDGGSSDETMFIVNDYARIYPYVTANSEPDNGIADAFNKGIRKATGELIGLINSDDELFDGALSLVADKYIETGADVIYGDTVVVDEENHLSMIKKAKQMSMVKYEMPFIHQSSFITKKAYEIGGLYDSKYKTCMDYDLVARFFHMGFRFEYAGGVLSVFRYGGTSCKHPFRTISENFDIAEKYGLKPMEGIPYKFKIISRNAVKQILIECGLWSNLYAALKKGTRMI